MIEVTSHQVCSSRSSVHDIGLAPFDFRRVLQADLRIVPGSFDDGTKHTISDLYSFFVNHVGESSLGSMSLCDIFRKHVYGLDDR